MDELKENLQEKNSRIRLLQDRFESYLKAGDAAGVVRCAIYCGKLQRELFKPENAAYLDAFVRYGHEFYEECLPLFAGVVTAEQLAVYCGEMGYLLSEEAVNVLVKRGDMALVKCFLQSNMLENYLSEEAEMYVLLNYPYGDVLEYLRLTDMCPLSPAGEKWLFAEKTPEQVARFIAEGALKEPDTLQQKCAIESGKASRQITIWLIWTFFYARGRLSADGRAMLKQFGEPKLIDYYEKMFASADEKVLDDEAIYCGKLQRELFKPENAAYLDAFVRYGHEFYEECLPLFAGVVTAEQLAVYCGEMGYLLSEEAVNVLVKRGDMALVKCFLQSNTWENYLPKEAEMYVLLNYPYGDVLEYLRLTDMCPLSPASEKWLFAEKSPEQVARFIAEGALKEPDTLQQKCARESGKASRQITIGLIWTFFYARGRLSADGRAMLKQFGEPELIDYYEKMYPAADEKALDDEVDREFAPAFFCGMFS